MKQLERLEKQAADEIQDLLLKFGEYVQLECFRAVRLHQPVVSVEKMIDGFLEFKEKVNNAITDLIPDEVEASHE